MKRKLYIAYGSNLNKDQMHYRCMDAVKIGATVIKDYKLNFRGTQRGTGFANIERCKGSYVPVGIWAISAVDEEYLDLYEGYPKLYIKDYLQFTYADKKYTGLAYIMRPGHPELSPARWYEDTIRDGYYDFGIDTAYLDKALKNCRNEKKRDWNVEYAMNGNIVRYHL